MVSRNLEYYRAQAEEARRLAEFAQDSGTKKIHSSTAEEYEERVQELQQQLDSDRRISPA